ncbi:hypothetical protein BC936DRAFT_148179 [Jimgerdemannia flammicorona]|uniref:WW domain-containing protein n=1 Tax=Jimgerdemannia flammicorona TaxID=994334 RepID=A0A433D3T1_9FUNG|nr:hypothetical protein BC936DRAFT_148179 [Jimgerdemannia flammicorona]
MEQGWNIWRSPFPQGYRVAAPTSSGGVGSHAQFQISEIILFLTTYGASLSVIILESHSATLVFILRGSSIPKPYTPFHQTPTHYCTMSLPSGWEAKLAPSGRVYYINHQSKTTTWEKPSFIGYASNGIVYPTNPFQDINSPPNPFQQPSSTPIFYAVPIPKSSKLSQHGYYISATPEDPKKSKYKIYPITLNPTFQRTTHDIPQPKKKLVFKQVSTSVTVMGTNMSITNTTDNLSITTVVRTSVKLPGSVENPPYYTSSPWSKKDVRPLLKSILCCQCRIPKTKECPCILCTRHPLDNHSCQNIHDDKTHEMENHGKCTHSNKLTHTTRADFFQHHSAWNSNLVLGLLSIWAGDEATIAKQIWKAFRDAWKHPKEEYGKVIKSSNHSVSFFQPDPDIVSRFEAYVAACYERDPHVNIVPLWHGTTTVCSGKTCLDFSGCVSCHIMTKGFSNKHTGKRAWQRYGPGIYFASNTSKAHSYVNVDSNAKPQAVNGKFTQILSFVALGRVFETFENDLSYLTGAPPNSDSLHGNVKKKRTEDKDLRFDEYVVYKAEAVMPVACVEYEVTF